MIFQDASASLNPLVRGLGKQLTETILAHQKCTGKARERAETLLDGEVGIQDQAENEAVSV